MLRRMINQLCNRRPCYGPHLGMVSLRRELDTTKNHLWSSPVLLPFYTTYQVLRQSPAACKALKVLKTTVLKRPGVSPQVMGVSPSVSGA
jgi:hypothetical protein